MQRRKPLILLVLACCAGMTPHAWAQRTLQVSTLLDSDPPTRLAEAILMEAYQRLGIQLQVLHQPGERSLVNANDGVTDGELYRKAGLEAQYPRLLRVPVALLSYEVVAFTTQPKLYVLDWAGLQPYRLGYVRGIKIIEENVKGKQAVALPTLPKAFEMLALGRVDLVLANRDAGLTDSRAINLQGLRMLEPPLASFPVYHYLHQKHADLLPRVAQVLLEMERDKTISKLRAQLYDEP